MAPEARLALREQAALTLERIETLRQAIHLREEIDVINFFKDNYLIN